VNCCNHCTTITANWRWLGRIRSQ